MGMTPPMDDAQVEALLGAYALDACAPDEVAAVEELLARRLDLAAEANRLANAAVWVGATEALEAPAGLRASVLDRARARRGAAPGDDEALRVYTASTARLDDVFEALVPDDHDVETPNGLNARELVVHLAAQESLLAQSIGASPVPEVQSTDVTTRTTALVERLADRPVDDARELWRRSVDAITAWASDPGTRGAPLSWLDVEMPRDQVLVIRAFENWIHHDDLRAASGLVTDPPPADDLHAMGELSVGTLPLALVVLGRDHPGRVARVVLTGPGGGEWTIGLAGEEVAADAEPDVTITADIVDWCRMAGERLAADDLAVTITGDESLAADLLAAAPAFATL
jgi:uncharacterized protein (TIGR03083 family)